MAEAWAEGALGIEEREDGESVALVIYIAAADEVRQRDTVAGFASEGVWIESLEGLDDVDWSERWKVGLEAIVISDRLVVRPSFVAHAVQPGQRELVVDPGCAFGTGGHASTRLLLEWIDELAAGPVDRLTGRRVLDVGTGTGALAMAAVALGAARAVGFDLDSQAVREASVWTQKNGLSDRVSLFTGGIDALAAPPFDWVLANLLRSEVLPIADRLAAAVTAGGGLLLSGLLESDGPPVIDAFSRLGLEPAGERSRRDPTGDRWIAPLMIRPR